MKFDLEHIIWDDSASDSLQWRSVEDAIDYDDDLRSIAHSAGFVIFEDDNYVMLTLSFMEMAEDATASDTNVHGLLRIPKCSIKSRKVLIKSNKL
jgi:hypothetical protein